MQAQGAARGGGVSTIPRRGDRRLEVLLTVAAILVIVAVMALMMTRGMVAPADTGGVGAQDAKAGVVGSAIVHDDAGSVHSGLAAPGYAPVPLSMTMLATCPLLARAQPSSTTTPATSDRTLGPKR
jgi:hypothetical protein